MTVREVSVGVHGRLLRRATSPPKTRRRCRSAGTESDLSNSLVVSPSASVRTLASRERINSAKRTLTMSLQSVTRSAATKSDDSASPSLYLGHIASGGPPRPVSVPLRISPFAVLLTEALARECWRIGRGHIIGIDDVTAQSRLCVEVLCQRTARLVAVELSEARARAVSRRRTAVLACSMTGPRHAADLEQSGLVTLRIRNDHDLAGAEAVVGVSIIAALLALWVDDAAAHIGAA